MTETKLPDLEPRSSTLDALDNAIATLTHARSNVLDEVRYLGTEIDNLRKELADWTQRALDAERAQVAMTLDEEAEKALPKKRRAPRARGNIARMISAELDAGVTDE